MTTSGKTLNEIAVPAGEGEGPPSSPRDPGSIRCACRAARQRLFGRQGTALTALIIVMAQPLHPTRPLQDNSSTAGRTSSVLLLAGAGFGGLVVIGAFALWFHYGTQVFFEMIRTGFSACF
ncbi:hypothetical protein [Bradyrhizobium sp.]|uniref:hypothetical protein n=1 Tax=Bradyrhizobium sp. TaxID=376 RepID=UPI0039E417A8